MFFSVVDVVEPLPEQLDTPYSDYRNVLIIMYKKRSARNNLNATEIEVR